MTTPEKISRLRAIFHLSQEELAKKLGVSRQCIAKWESGNSMPQVENIITLCDLFSITADQLLRDDIQIAKTDNSLEKHENKYFGTDGFRGEANKDLTSDHAYKIGRFLGWYYHSPLSGNLDPEYRPRIVIGKDTRKSSYMLEYAMASGIAASGGDCYILHVTTSPSVAFITRLDEFDCGVVITASHNPYYDNGIKIISKNGEKFDDKTLSLIEAYLDGDMEKIGICQDDLPRARRERIGSVIDYYAGRNRYIGYLISLAMHSYQDLRIGLDCANGASFSIAKTVFEALGAKIYCIGVEPNGLNVNDCGSTHVEKLQELVKEKHLDVGYAFDGDADRCIAVDENGEIIDGDKILYILAARLKRKNGLDHETVVTTVMSNSGLSRALQRIGIRTIHTAVGDRNIYEEMVRGGYMIGSEPTGHIILRQYATTGDGILTAIMLSEEMKSRRQPLSTLCAPVSLYPQVMKNVVVVDKDEAVNDPDVVKKVREIGRELGENGRVLLRKSGTEPVIRIMVEAMDSSICDEYIDRIYKVIKRKGYVHE